MGRGARIAPQQIEHYFTLRAQGWSMAKSAQGAGFSLETAKKQERLRRESATNGSNTYFRHGLDIPEWAIAPEKWNADTQEAMADRTGARFCKRYMGFELSPWQRYLWEALEDAWDSDDREYLCVNVAPGLGKSTVLVGFAGKLTARKRDLRGLFMSAASSLAVRNTLRLRRLLERTVPFADAEECMAKEFGRFKARTGELWRREEFIVEQFDGAPIEEKEPTWSAFGFDAEWLGNRLDVLFGDDMDSTKRLRNIDVIEVNRDVFDNEFEPRIEGGGLLCLTQQRLGPFDFSAHVLEKQILDDQDDADEVDHEEGVPMYRHIVFPAHDEPKCKQKETHLPDPVTGIVPAWPDGCLLDPRRLSWKDMRAKMRNRHSFEVVYQQNDMAGDTALVQPVWVYGGKDTSGQYFQGCYDKERDVWELPGSNMASGYHLLGPETYGVITVDPSPTKYWSVQAWVPHFPSNQLFLVDHMRDKMEAPDFLDWAPSLNKFTGLAEDWRWKFNQMGVPLAWVIVEINAAQRFMLQYEFFHRWMRETGVQIQAHSTGRNKSDEELGVQMVAPWWRDGRVRLPGKQGIKNPFNPPFKLVEEITKYPHSSTDDCVMSHWFLVHSLERLYNPTPELGAGPPWRPSWIGGGDAAA